VIDTANNTVVATVAVGAFPIAFGQFIQQRNPSTPGKVNGGGFIQSDGTMTDATLLIQNGINASVGDKANFGFVAQFGTGDPSPRGNLHYDDHAGNVIISALSFTVLKIGDGVCGVNTHARINGAASVPGPSGVPSTQGFEVEVDDCGGPSSTPPPDTFKITTMGPTSYMAVGPVVGGMSPSTSKRWQTAR
jgi:hypothetical protein